MGLDTKILRVMWMLVETSNPYNISKLSDGEIIKQLIQQIQTISSLSLEDSQVLSKYISSRTTLIRDLAYSKIC